MRRAAAVTTWVYAAGFGLSALPVAKHLNDKGYLPSFRDWFTLFGGPWSNRFAGHESETLVALLIAFFLVTLVASVFAWMFWRGSELGAALSLAWLPVEAVFWYGFALPLPWLIGVLRAVLVALAWKSFGAERATRTPAESA
ncbi:MAG: hypothetical protein ICV67_02975 [Thermoleophilia bacterium]|nr:hypothetical protein [Thermoleophilia bacterium]